ncbi:ParB/RepB/Spo0J family partition protein [Neoroseomonas rubea]|uniref:ParB/RepB/Spo0J family partition protein n=1 Tax=Neoroseomonas rubea TaxID=2748666 RepID=UPI0018DFC17E|nr:ParB/RepB/Spo0J family partition protein [Roseomonas rubea]
MTNKAIRQLPQRHEPEEIEVGEVIIDQRLQPRLQQNFQTIIRYKEALEDGVCFPPITVARIDGLLLLVDGFHRLKAHSAAGKATIEAVILEGVTREEAFFEAVIANTQHGLGLTKEEKRAAFRRYIRAKRHVLKDGRVKSLPQWRGAPHAAPLRH